MLLFSIPVHEKPWVVLNQIENFQKFNPACQIVLHVSRAMIDSDFEVLKTQVLRLSGVYITPTRLLTGWADGSLFKAHVANIRYAIENNVFFTHVCLHASNDMFVKTGLMDWIGDSIAGFDGKNRGKHNPVYQQIDHFKRDWASQQIFRNWDLNPVLGSQVEGSFYNYELAKLIVGRVGDMYDLKGIFSFGIHPKRGWRWWIYRFLEIALRRINSSVRITPFCKEEVYFPTLVSDQLDKGKVRKMNYCFVNWHRNLQIITEEINWIRESNFEMLHKSKNVSFDTSDEDEIAYFAVKRVERDLEDPIRMYINELN